MPSASLAHGGGTPLTARLVAAMVLALAAPATAQTVVDTCGQSVDGNAILMADLDCSAAPDYTVRLTRSATFDLNGFVLTGQVTANVKRLRIEGPGTITGPGYGVENRSADGAIITIDNASISGNELSGVYVEPAWDKGANVRLIDADVSSNGDQGVRLQTSSNCPFQYCEPRNKIDVLRSTVMGNVNDGLDAAVFKVRDSTISGNGRDGILQFAVGRTRSVSIRDSVIDDNGRHGLHVSALWATVKIKGSSLSGNSSGVAGNFPGEFVSKCSIRTSTLTGNLTGVSWPRRLVVAKTTIAGNMVRGIRHDATTLAAPDAPVLLGATLSGNGTSCPSDPACADLVTKFAPKLRSGSTCETSFQLNGSGMNWGICALD